MNIFTHFVHNTLHALRGKTQNAIIGYSVSAMTPIVYSLAIKWGHTLLPSNLGLVIREFNLEPSKMAEL